LTAFAVKSGLSVRNLLAIKVFDRERPTGPIVKQPVSQLRWGQIIHLIQMVKEPVARDFYIRDTLVHRWSRSILELQIQNQLHLRASKAQNNFHLTMPPADSDIAAQLFKDPLPQWMTPAQFPVLVDVLRCGPVLSVLRSKKLGQHRTFRENAASDAARSRAQMTMRVGLLSQGNFAGRAK
jgi:hypothetical protein